MKIKEGVILAGLDIRMRPVLIAAERIWQKAGHELVVTSGLEGTHSAGSLHYYGLALDFRTHYLNAEQLPELAEKLREALGPDYDVVIEKTHIHVEYDPEDEGEQLISISAVETALTALLRGMRR